MTHQRKQMFRTMYSYSFAALLATVCAFNNSKANNKPAHVVYLPVAIATTVAEGDSVYVKVDKQPSFTGGADALTKFLLKNLKYPTEMENREIEGRVIVQFIVEKDGALTDVKALRGPGHGSSEEAVRVMKRSPNWQPGYKDGHAVRTLVKMPVNFILQKIDPRQQTSGIKVINGG
jgi:TonB family protein